MTAEGTAAGEPQAEPPATPGAPAPGTPAAPVGGPGTAPDAPAVPVGGRWVGALSLANLGVWVGWFGPLQLLLARQAEHLAPDHKAATLALVTGVGAAVSMVANPVFGALSDRTTAAVGRDRKSVV